MDIIFILKAIIIAIVEGLTEFIPVSSTGHMILVGWAIGFDGEFAKMFEVVIQLGAIMAVVVLYWKKIEESIVEFFSFIFTRGKKGKMALDLELMLLWRLFLWLLWEYYFMIK